MIEELNESIKSKEQHIASAVEKIQELESEVMELKGEMAFKEQKYTETLQQKEEELSIELELFSRIYPVDSLQQFFHATRTQKVRRYQYIIRIPEEAKTLIPPPAPGGPSFIGGWVFQSPSPLT